MMATMVSFANAQTLLHTFNDPTVTDEDRFGHSVAIDGDNVLIGAYRDDTNGTNVGQAHLFNAATGNLLHTFNDPNVTSGDAFGWSVAIDGNNVLIGAAWDDTNSTNDGQVHLFDAATGNLLRTFNDPTPANFDHFGWSVAIDGNNVLIGAVYDDTKGITVGQAHLFAAATGNLLHTFNDPTVTTEDNFGHSVAIDGNNVLIGALYDDTNGANVGQAHLFDAATGNLLHTFNDPTVTTGDNFGCSVAIDGNNVLIGAAWDDTNGTNAGQVHLFDAATGNLLRTFNDPTPASYNHFGYSVAIDGDNVLIGVAFNGAKVGQALLFDAATGNLLHTFNDPTVTTEDNFGCSVAIDGDNILIGALYDDTNGADVGQAHLFTPEPATLSLLVVGGLAVLRRRRK